MEDLPLEQSSLIDEYLIAELELTNITHTMIGGYNAATYSSKLSLSETPRASEIKGIWRWWFRTCLAGAIWESYGSLDEQRQRSVKELTKKILGSSEGGASCVVLQVIPLKIGSLEKLDRESKIPRMILLSRAKEGDKLMCYKPHELRFKIRVLKRPDALIHEETIHCLIGSLLMSIIFQGIGAATRRGFGSLNICSFKVPRRYERVIGDYKELVEKLNKSTDKNQCEEVVKDLIQKTLKEFSSLIGVELSHGQSIRALPPFPIVTKDRDIFKLTVKELYASDEKDLLRKIGMATMKSQWKLVRGMHIGSAGRDKNTLSTFMLGLPRKGEHRNKRTFYSGYWIKFDEEKREGDPGRRPSAISIRAMKHIGGSRWLCLIYGMLSKDWPDRLIRRSVHYRREFKQERLVPYKDEKDEDFKLDEKTLQNRFNNAFDMVIRCLR